MRVAAFRTGPLKARRRPWAELAAWMALSLRHQQSDDDWPSFAIQTKELLGSRPLDDICLTRVIADTTLNVMSVAGSRRAASGRRKRFMDVWSWRWCSSRSRSLRYDLGRQFYFGRVEHTEPIATVRATGAELNQITLAKSIDNVADAADRQRQVRRCD